MSFDTSSDNLARMAAQGLRLDPPPTEAEIDDVLERLAAAFGANPSEVLETRRLLHARFSIRMGQTIKVEHAPWLDSPGSALRGITAIAAATGGCGTSAING